jgi:hypothetical protein
MTKKRITNECRLNPVSAGMTHVIAGLTRNPQKSWDTGIRRYDGAFAAQSRRDGTLLTVGFNLRTGSATAPPQVPQGRPFVLFPCFGGWVGLDCVVPAGLVETWRAASYRRLKPTVNKVSSLRDFTVRVAYLAPAFHHC